MICGATREEHDHYEMDVLKLAVFHLPMQKEVTVTRRCYLELGHDGPHVYS